VNPGAGLLLPLAVFTAADFPVPARRIGAAIAARRKP